MRFLRYLTAALELAGLPVDSFASKLLETRQSLNLKDFATTLVNELLAISKDIVLFLDDYHLIHNQVIHEVVAFIIEHSPENLHTVLISRADPPLALERLRARGRLVEIRFDDLRFTAGEIDEFFHAIAHKDLTRAEIEKLETTTEGWVTALQLTALAIQNRPLKQEALIAGAGNNRFVLDYLMSEVVASQSDDVKEFLHVTAVLERMSASLCDALLDLSAKSRGSDSIAGRSAEILRYLDQSNLFVIRLDETGDWYRYHHLFRDFLRSQLGDRTPNSSDLHRCASEWYQNQGLIAEAMSHAFATLDWDYAAEVLERCGLPILMNSEMRTIFEWTDAFPAEVVRQRPMLSLMHAWAPVLSYSKASRSQVEEYIRDAEQAADGLEDELERRKYRGHAALVRCFLAMIPETDINPEAEVSRGQYALDLFPTSDPIRCTCELPTAWAFLAIRDTAAARHHFQEARRLAGAGPDYFCEIDATYYEIQIAREQGRLTEVLRSSQHARDHYTEILEARNQHVSALGTFDIAIGSVLAEQDHLAEAEDALRNGLSSVAGCSEAYHQMIGYLVLARAHEAQGRLADADQDLAQLEEAWPDVAFLTRALRVQQLLRTAPTSQQALLAALSFAEAVTPFASSSELHLPGLGPCGCSEAYYRAYLAWVYSQIASGKTALALEYIEAQLQLSTSHDLFDRVIGLSVAKAQALLVKGQAKNAHDAFRAALILGEREGYVRVFDEGPLSQRLLVRFASERGPQREYAARLLSCLYPSASEKAAIEVVPQAERLPETQSVLVTREGEPVGLPTRRELDVLRLVAEGCSNAEIASQLFIELGTVKQHLNRTMHKLHAATRAEAVARGRLLGLLDDQ